MSDDYKPSLGDIFEIDKHPAAIAVSFVFVILFFITQTIELNKVLLDFGVSDNVITKGKLIYTYLAGYFLYIIKFIIALLTLIFLVSIIVVIITSCMFVIKLGTHMGKDMANSASRFQETNENNLIAEITKWIIDVIRYLISFIFVKQFKILNIVIIPLFLFSVYLLYSFILYKPDKIVDDKNKSNIMNTNHMYLFYLFVSIMIFMLFYVILIYLKSRK
jgi:hypothetical protein